MMKFILQLCQPAVGVSTIPDLSCLIQFGPMYRLYGLAINGKICSICTLYIHPLKISFPLEMANFLSWNTLLDILNQHKARTLGVNRLGLRAHQYWMLPPLTTNIHKHHQQIFPPWQQIFINIMRKYFRLWQQILIKTKKAEKALETEQVRIKACSSSPFTITAAPNDVSTAGPFPWNPIVSFQLESHFIQRSRFNCALS